MPSKRKKNRFNRIFRWTARKFAWLVLFLFLLTVIQVVTIRFIDPPFTAAMGWSWLQCKMDSRHYSPPRSEWRRLEEISPHLKQAVLAAEDQRFLLHHGFDFIELDRAFRDLFADRRIRGASTITMQVARTLFLWPERSWLRKALEAYYTVLLELFLSKKRIYELYLNTVDWGEGIMGAEAASMKYFRISSGLITPTQGALLAAILPSPHRWSPTNPNAMVTARKRRILKDLKKMPLL